ncbi:hypothetical protein ACGFIW_02030 [Micromonospora sp. NPDC048935]|uniref:hypothetical protein n=1 Tax=Micromonospora sp. NPDC048935 TaxID=3364262 RepID=UPI00371FFCFE
MRAFLSSQAVLASRVVVLEDAVERAAAHKRRDDAFREVTVKVLRDDLAAARREAESLDAGNQTLIEQIRRAEVTSSRQAHRIAAAFRFAEQLPPDLATELRGRLALTFPSVPEEAARAH